MRNIFDCLRSWTFYWHIRPDEWYDDNDDVDLKLVRRGSQGDTVKKLQECLGLDADGDFGRGTEAALKAWQVENGCTPDGIAGPQTLGKIFS